MNYFNELERKDESYTLIIILPTFFGLPIDYIWGKNYYFRSTIAI